MITCHTHTNYSGNYITQNSEFHLQTRVLRCWAPEQQQKGSKQRGRSNRTETWLNLGLSVSECHLCGLYSLYRWQNNPNTGTRKKEKKKGLLKATLVDKGWPNIIKHFTKRLFWSPLLYGNVQVFTLYTCDLLVALLHSFWYQVDMLLYWFECSLCECSCLCYLNLDPFPVTFFLCLSNIIATLMPCQFYFLIQHN